MGWLTGWGQRIRLIIDHNDIDDSLTNFPVLVYLSTSSGRNNSDVSFIFDELLNDANRKKIAVTKADGVTECYVEIEHWDHANEKAWLWVKVPDVDPDVDTAIYLYYDKTHADNDAYVGDPSDAVVHNVWDANFKLVSHMRDDPDNAHIRDSTVNANDGTKLAAGEPAVTTVGKIDDAQDFDGGTGNDDKIVIPHNAGLNLSVLTVEAWIEFGAPAPPVAGYIWNKFRVPIPRAGFNFWHYNIDNKFYFQATEGPAWPTWSLASTNAYSTGVHYVVITNDESYMRMYIDGVEAAIPLASGVIAGGTTDAWIGRSIAGDNYTWQGFLDEMRASNVARNAAWIKASYESGRDDLIDFGFEEPPPCDFISAHLTPDEVEAGLTAGWSVNMLPGWGKRVKILLDHNDIDVAQSDFPHLVYLSTSSGHSNKDVSCVFDELLSSANRKKIAVTTSDGQTECYVEIEHWDHAGEEAWLWVKVPDVDPDMDTVLYLYYDSTHADNDAYVGDPSDAVVHNVWDANHKLVSHMRDDPDNQHIRDSTQYANDGTKIGAGEPAVTTEGKIDDAQSFDGNNDRVNCGNDPSLDNEAAGSIAFWVRRIETDGGGGVIERRSPGGGWVDQRYTFDFTGDTPRFNIANGVANLSLNFNGTITNGQWFYLVATHNGIKMKGYINGALDKEQNQTITPEMTGFDLRIGQVQDLGRYLDGHIDEIQLSDIDRTAAWWKACYESQRDHLNDFGIEEHPLLSGIAILTSDEVVVSLR